MKKIDIAVEISNIEDLLPLMSRYKDGDTSYIFQWIKILSNIYKQNEGLCNKLIPTAQANWRTVFRNLPRFKYLGMDTGVHWNGIDIEQFKSWGFLEEYIAVRIGWSTLGLRTGTETRKDILLEIPADSQLDKYGQVCHSKNDNCDVQVKFRCNLDASWVSLDKSYSLSQDDFVKLPAEILVLLTEEGYSCLSLKYPRSLLNHLDVMCTLDGRFVSLAFDLLKRHGRTPNWSVKDWAPLCCQGLVEGSQEIYYGGAWRRCDKILLLNDVSTPLSDRRALIKPESEYYVADCPEDSSILSSVHDSWGFLDSLPIQELSYFSRSGNKSLEEFKCLCELIEVLGHHIAFYKDMICAIGEYICLPGGHGKWYPLNSFKDAPADDGEMNFVDHSVLKPHMENPNFLSGLKILMMTMKVPFLMHDIIPAKPNSIAETSVDNSTNIEGKDISRHDDGSDNRELILDSSDNDNRELVLNPDHVSDNPSGYLEARVPNEERGKWGEVIMHIYLSLFEEKYDVWKHWRSGLRERGLRDLMTLLCKLGLHAGELTSALVPAKDKSERKADDRLGYDFELDEQTVINPKNTSRYHIEVKASTDTGFTLSRHERDCALGNKRSDAIYVVGLVAEMTFETPKRLIKKAVEYWKLDAAEKDKQRLSFAEACRRIIKLHWLYLDSNNFQYTEHTSWMVRPISLSVSTASYGSSSLSRPYHHGFKTSAELNGCSVRTMASDGHCFYHAVAHQLNAFGFTAGGGKGPITYQHIRGYIADFIEANYAQDQSGIWSYPASDNSRHEVQCDPTHYADLVRHGNLWGSAIEMSLIIEGCLYEITNGHDLMIQVYQSDFTEHGFFTDSIQGALNRKFGSLQRVEDIDHLNLRLVFVGDNHFNVLTSLDKREDIIDRRPPYSPNKNAKIGGQEIKNDTKMSRQEIEALKKAIAESRKTSVDEENRRKRESNF